MRAITTQVFTGALAAIAMTALSGCGMAQGSASSSLAAPTESVAKPAKPVLASELAARLGCTSLKPAAQDGGAPWFGSREDVTCQVDRTPVSLVTFTLGTDVPEWVAGVESMGGVWLVGKGWAAQTSTQPVAERVRAKLGGQIR